MTDRKGSYWDSAVSGRISRRRALAGVAGGAGLAALTLAGCGGNSGNGGSSNDGGSSGSGGTPKPGGTLVVSSVAEGSHWDIHQTAEPHTQFTWQLIGSNLMWWDPFEFKATPNVAEKWEQPDDLTVVVHLVKGIKFDSRPPYNGRELTASDVKFTFERIATKDDPRFLRRGTMDSVASIEATDPYTVRFNLKEPSAPFLSYLADSYAVIVGKELVDIAGDLRQSRSLFGSGPFIVDQLIPGTSISFKKNPDYFKQGRPYLDRVEFNILSDASTRDSAFLSGNVDLPYPPSGLTQDQVKGRLRDAVIIESVSTTGTRYAIWNWQRKPYDDVRVRKAVSLAMDRQQTIDLVAEGLGKVLAGPIPSGLTAWALPESEVAKLPGYRSPKDQDIAEAKRLLGAPGFPDGFKAESPASQQYDFSFMKVNLVVQPMLKAVGIDLDIEPIADYAAYLKRQSDGLYDITAGTAINQSEDPDPHLSTYIQTGGGRNYNFFSDAKADSLVLEQRRTLDTEKRKSLVLDLQRYLLDVVDRAWLHSSANWTVQRGYVKGLPEISGISSGRFAYLIEEAWLDGKPA